MSLNCNLKVDPSDSLTTYTASVSDSAKCSITQKLIDYKLTTTFRDDAVYNVPNLKDAISKMEISIKLPNGSEVIYTDPEITYTYQYSSTVDRYFIHVSISNKTELTSQLGDVLGLVNMYNASNQIIVRAAFVITVTAMTGLAKNTQKVRLDFWPGAIPTRIHVNQYDQNIQLMIYGYNSKGGCAISSTSTGGSRVTTFLEGKRPDGQNISVAVDNFSNVTNKPFYTVYTAFILPQEFTEIPGEYLLQFCVRHVDVYTNSPTKEMRSSKIILIVESAP